MKTTTNHQHSSLIRKYHTLATKMGLDKHDRDAIMESYGVTSSLDLSVSELSELCTQLERDPLDKSRKMAMASIGGWLKLTGQESSTEIIHSIACRVTKKKYFNQIPKDRLLNLYHGWLNKQKDFKAMNYIAAEDMKYLSSVN